MISAVDLQDVFADHAAWCEVRTDGEDAARQVLMVTQALSSGSINSRKSLLAFIDKSVLPMGADWAYGLIWHADAPEGMRADIRMTVTDSAGQVWSCEAAKAVYDIDPETRRKVTVAWRLALRGKQRMTR